MDDLLALLGRERHALDRLLFRLLELRHLLATGEARFLHLAAHDLDAAVGAIGEVELTRALLDPTDDDTTLHQLAAASVPPIDGILEDHRAAIGRLAAEVGATVEAVTELAEHGLRQLDEHVSEHDELDRAIVGAGYEAVLSATSRLNLPSLAAFLG